MMDKKPSVRFQEEILKGSPPFVELVRPCTVGDGIIKARKKQMRLYSGIYRKNPERFSASAFIPASGAASRMFASLMSNDGGQVQRFCRNINKFAFYDDLKHFAEKQGKDISAMNNDDIVHLLISPEEMGYSDIPKGLVPFHRYGGVYPYAGTPLNSKSLCPFAEHIHLARSYTSTGEKSAVHFTVSHDFYDDLKLQRRQNVPAEISGYFRRPDKRADLPPDSFFALNRVDFSVQNPETDTIALGENGKLLTGPDGGPVFRPSGHGALIDNLNGIDTDIVFISNIDNIPHALRVRDLPLVKAALAGILVKHAGERPPERPLRVCGVVKNTGEPGGGPFWVRDKSGNIRPQIVESVQVDRSDAGQEKIWSSATHFNPVDMVCFTKRPDGGKFNLREFGDFGPDAFMVTEKTHKGRKIKALEMPGLWNGAMAGWDTVFVEIPRKYFNPVKEVFDLLRNSHQDLKNE